MGNWWSVVPGMESGKANDPQYFWKSEWHDEWFPLPQKLQNFLNESPSEPICYGIFLHEDPHCIYGSKFIKYVLDPSQLAVWRFDAYTTSSKSAQGNVVVFLKAIDSSGNEREADKNAIHTSKCPYSPDDLQMKMCFRPSELPRNPRTIQMPTGGAGYQPLHELESEYSWFSNAQKWVPYHPKIQRQLNRSDEPMEFAIYTREWPELFGGGFNRYLIDPKNLFQISLDWARTREVVKVNRATGKRETKAIDQLKYRISFNYTQHYPQAKKLGVFHQKDLES